MTRFNVQCSDSMCLINVTRFDVFSIIYILNFSLNVNLDIARMCEKTSHNPLKVTLYTMIW